MPFTPTPYPLNTTGKALRGHALEGHRARLYAWEAESLMAAFLADHPEIPEGTRDALMEHVSTKAREWGQVDGQRQEVIVHLSREVTQDRRTINALVDATCAGGRCRDALPSDHPDVARYDAAYAAAVDVARLNACEPE